MKLAAIAIDYDGTMASNGVIDPDVRQAIAEVRRSGILVMLATGRRLDDLRRVLTDLASFDLIVAENGAVLQFPASGRHVVLGHPPANCSSTSCGAGTWSLRLASASSRPTLVLRRSCSRSCGDSNCR